CSSGRRARWTTFATVSRKAPSMAPTATAETPKLPMWRRFDSPWPKLLRCRARPNSALHAAPRKGSSAIHQSGVSDGSRSVIGPEYSDIGNLHREPGGKAASSGLDLTRDPYGSPAKGGRTLAERPAAGQGPLGVNFAQNFLGASPSNA